MRKILKYIWCHCGHYMIVKKSIDLQLKYVKQSIISLNLYEEFLNLLTSLSVERAENYSEIAIASRFSMIKFK